MRKLFLALGALGLLSGAHAETSPVRNWSGLYLGGTAGMAEGRAHTGASTSDGFTGSYFTSPDPEQIAAESDRKATQSRWAGGLFGGYGRQFDKLYVGAEASINSLNFDETQTSGAVYQSNPAGKFSNRLSVKADWQATLRARVGWAQDKWLAYVTGGVAAARLKLDAAFSDDFLGAGATGQDANKEIKLGWVLGLGGEYALSDSWTLRAEYLYADYGKVSTSAVVTNPAFPAFANTLQNSVELKTQTLSVGVSYRF